ncbi:methionine aminotransferase [Acinetobacter sp. YH12041]|uniref:methionine aminotransferase n=1 Tax=Acinetobacter sp. YH12041 TaxID=2601049 RepID=UPI0015D369AB|nr:methionine aminotransferase [Acinetobacter sp. YH12041]
MLELHSKLPNLGVTIFSTMSALAQKLGAINLSQGFPDFPAPPQLIEALSRAAENGFNQYAPGDGLPVLRGLIADLYQHRDQLILDPVDEITITPGATIAIFCAIQATVRTGEEVIIFDPSYDSYAPSVKLVGAKPVHIALAYPDFSVDWNKVKDAINDRTRMIVVNTPHNPTGTVWTEQDWQQLIELIRDRNIVVLSDEVYEHLVFDEVRHHSAASFPELRERSFVIGSFGKTFHVTGWKTGFCVAPPALMQMFRQIYQFVSFCGVTPIQVALTEYMQLHSEHIHELSGFYQAKRDLFNHALTDSRFHWTPSQGTYFQNLDYSEIRPDLDALSMCHYLAKQHGVVAIPVSAFYQEPPKDLHLLRFCFAKKDETLIEAAHILSKV